MQMANPEAAIRERAYAIWEEEGRPHGLDWDHWSRAKQELSGRASPAATRAASAAAVTARPARKTAGSRLRRFFTARGSWPQEGSA